jgi:hypothetical protein
MHDRWFDCSWEWELKVCCFVVGTELIWTHCQLLYLGVVEILGLLFSLLLYHSCHFETGLARYSCQTLGFVADDWLFDAALHHSGRLGTEGLEFVLGIRTGYQ